MSTDDRQISIKVTSLWKRYKLNDSSFQLDISSIDNDHLFFPETINILVCLRVKNSH